MRNWQAIRDDKLRQLSLSASGALGCAPARRPQGPSAQTADAARAHYANLGEIAILAQFLSIASLGNQPSSAEILTRSARWARTASQSVD